MKKLKLVLVFLFLSMFNHSFSSSILGGGFSWTQIGKDSFIISLELYNDCNGEKPGKIYVDVWCLDGIKIKTLEMSGATPTDITPTCNNAQTRCDDPNSDLIYGVEKYVFQKLLILEDHIQCCQVKLTFNECCRSVNIDNGGAGTKFYTEAMFSRCLLRPDNSPRITNPSVAFICKDRLFSFCDGISEHDVNSTGGLLDSLAYEMVSPETPTGPITYKQQYDYDRPLYFDGFPDAHLPSPRGFHLMPVGGLVFTPKQNERTVFRKKITEFRFGEIIGYTYRDYYMIVIECSNSKPQIVSNEYMKTVFPGNEVKFEINTYDFDVDDNLVLGWNQGISGATWTDNNGKVKRPKAIFSWIPASEHISNLPYVFTVNVKDDHCPYILSETRAFQILVKDPNAGIEEAEKGNIVVYPVPASNILSIKSDKIFNQLQLFDMAGKLIINRNLLITNSYQLDVSMIEKGIYFLKVDQLNIKKIILE